MRRGTSREPPQPWIDPPARSDQSAQSPPRQPREGPGVDRPARGPAEISPRSTGSARRPLGAPPLRRGRPRLRGAARVSAGRAPLSIPPPRLLLPSRRTRPSRWGRGKGTRPVWGARGRESSEGEGGQERARRPGAFCGGGGRRVVRTSICGQAMDGASALSWWGRERACIPLPVYPYARVVRVGPAPRRCSPPPPPPFPPLPPCSCAPAVGGPWQAPAARSRPCGPSRFGDEAGARDAAAGGERALGSRSHEPAPLTPMGDSMLTPVSLCPRARLRRRWRVVASCPVITAALRGGSRGTRRR